MIVTLDEAKQYLRIDTDAEDETLTLILGAAEKLCADVARVEVAALEALGEIAKGAVLYAFSRIYEAREDVDTHDLTLKLRALMFGVREIKF